jgi:Flp pilus assembly protein TadB
MGISLTAIEVSIVLFAQAFGAVVGGAALWRYLEKEYRKREARWAMQAARAEESARAAEDRFKTRLDFVMEMMRENNSRDSVAEDYQVLDKLMTNFSIEEMALISFEMGVRWDLLPGATPATKALGLVTKARERDKIGELVKIMTREKPEPMRTV